jgi:hypothetical protein
MFSDLMMFNMRPNLYVACNNRILVNLSYTTLHTNVDVGNMSILCFTLEPCNFPQKHSAFRVLVSFVDKTIQEMG